MDEIKGAWLASAMGIFFGWTFLAWLVRAWAKARTHSWSLDDWAISASMLAAIVHLVFISYAIRSGYGEPFDTYSESTVTQIELGLYLAQIFYILSFGLCRVASAFFISYISQSGPYVKPARILAVVTGVWTIASVLVICIRGDIAQPWSTLDGSRNMFIRWLAIEIVAIVIELALWGVAAHLVWGIKLKLSKRIMIIAAFGARLLVIPFLIARLVYLDPRANTGPTHSATISDILTEACVYFSIIAGCSTALKPLLTSFYSTHPAMDMTTSTSGLRSKDRTGGDPYYRLEAIKPAVVSNNGTSRKVIIDRTGVSDITWQSTLPAPGHHASAYSKSGSRSATTSRTDTSSHRRSNRLTGTLTSRNRDRDAAGSTASDDSVRMIIQKTTEVTVQYK